MGQRWAWTVVVGLVGCVEPPKGDGSEGLGEPAGSSGVVEDESSSAALPPDPEESSSTDPVEDESSTGCNFICPEETDHECDVWA